MTDYSRDPIKRDVTRISPVTKFPTVALVESPKFFGVKM